MFFGTAGPMVSLLEPPPTVLLNGMAHPAAMQFTAGKRYRLRFFNLAGDNPTVVSITDHDKPVMWRALAKDGYPLSVQQAKSQPAMLLFDPGEIYDFEFTPAHAGAFTLAFGLPQPAPPKPGDPPPPASTVPPLTKVALHVVAP